MKSFKEFVSNRIINEEQKKVASSGDWKKEYVKLEKGFVPPQSMRPVVQAFLDSGSISLTDDVSKKVTMPKKSLFLVGGPVRDFLMGKAPKDLDLATNATPEQIAMILSNAGFNLVKKGPEWNLPFKPKIAEESDKKKYYLKGRDSSDKPFVVGAIVDGNEFDIATFRRDAKTINGKSEVDFVDNPHEDASRRDLTINAMYIELTKADGENGKLYDPTKKGYHDVHSGTVRAVGDAHERFEEDKLRVMRAIRFHAKYGGGKPMDSEMERAMSKFRNLEGLALERVKDEFVKGLEDPEIDPKKYVRLYDKHGLIGKVLPGVSINSNVPPQLRDKKDRFLALAWILQDNPIERVREVLGNKRKQGDNEVNTGWSFQEREVVCYLLGLKEFHVDNLPDLLEKKKVLGVTKEQIRKWVELFDVVDKNQVRSLRPNWSRRVRSFADFSPDKSKLVSWFARDDKGGRTEDIHPEIVQKNLAGVPPHFRRSVVDDLNRPKIKDMFDKHVNS